MTLDHEDQIILRAAEQAHMQVTEQGIYLIGGTAVEITPEHTRVQELLEAGHLAWSGNSGRIVATPKGMLEWRCASAEDLHLDMRMDDIFLRRAA